VTQGVPAEPRYPEHHKLGQVAHLTQAVADFLEWASGEHRVSLMQFDRRTSRWFDAPSLSSLLADWQDIDLIKLEAEKREMLDAQRRLNEGDA
jgi:hypothetical protein